MFYSTKISSIYVNTFFMLFICRLSSPVLLPVYLLLQILSSLTLMDYPMELHTDTITLLPLPLPTPFMVLFPLTHTPLPQLYTPSPLLL